MSYQRFHHGTWHWTFRMAKIQSNTESVSDEQQQLSTHSEISENPVEVWSRNGDADRENNYLVAENQKLLAELDAGQKREAELIEHLVSAQMRVDKLQAIRLAQKRTIADLKHSSLGRHGTGAQLDEASQATNKGLATSIRIRELEREVDYLTAHVEELSAKSQSKAAAWKYIEAQKDSLQVREELSKTRTLVEDLNDQIVQLRVSTSQAKREASVAQVELASMKRAHEIYAKKTREQINRLMRQIGAERRKAVHQTRAEIRQLDEMDSAERQQALEELRNEVGWLKYLSTVLQETCDALKLEHEQTKETETTLAHTKSELRRVRRELATVKLRAVVANTPSGPDQGLTTNDSVNSADRDEHKSFDSPIRNPLLQLKLENHKLHKLVQLLRTRLARKDPVFQSQYQFISGV
ncbi:hypothetical protein FGIG_04037 [Fasciola gigantica]|uniref:Uncharacterized protein n=1 Tax=Fasciola gigantica TaxID=46835 RepID=A0A504YD19_FASGI|nr:hypothetical protein FGIG_04037 [Fasciola gigantica]